MFGSKSVVFISDVGSGMDSGCSVQVSGLFCQVYEQGGVGRRERLKGRERKLGGE